VNSEHVPRPAGRGRVALERATAAYSMWQGVNSLQTPRAGKHPWTPAGAFCRAAHLPVVRRAGVGDLHSILAQGQQSSTRLLASSEYSPRHSSLADQGGAKWQRVCCGWSAAAAMSRVSRVSLLRRRSTARSEECNQCVVDRGTERHIGRGKLEHDMSLFELRRHASLGLAKV
jgi:hypothetical protein